MYIHILYMYIYYVKFFVPVPGTGISANNDLQLFVQRNLQFQQQCS